MDERLERIEEMLKKSGWTVTGEKDENGSRIVRPSDDKENK